MRQICGSNYVETCSVDLMGMNQLMLVKAEHVQHVNNIRICTVPCGLMEKLGNKGATSIGFFLYGTSFLFVNCHLAGIVLALSLLVSTPRKI